VIATEISQVFAGLWAPLLVITGMLAVRLSMTTAHVRQPFVNLCYVIDNR
jgi:hypothetical protein